MPIYEYQCKRCGEDFEELVGYNETTECPYCCSLEVKQCLSLPCLHTESGMPGNYTKASSCSGCSGGNCATC